jgi:mannose-6-phosphate isomerase-like protein (cupin superfamily)
MRYLHAMLARFAEHWSPKTTAQINDYDVRIVKVEGESTWHQHADTDEFFLILDGRTAHHPDARSRCRARTARALRRASRRRALPAR